MNSQSRSVMFVLTLLTVFALSTFMTAPVLADDGTEPPPDIPIGLTPPVGDESAVSDTQPAAIAPADNPPADAGLVDDMSVAPPAEPEALRELNEQLPEGTDVAIVNTEGKVLPLATEEASQAIVDGDPMWCPAGVAPGGATCSPSFTTFNQDKSTPAQTGVINWLVTNDPAKAGVIWIAWNYNGPLETGNSIFLNGYSYTNLDNYALTIQGGWNGVSGMALNAAQPYSTITVPLWVQNWTGAVTLKNIAVDDSTAPVNIPSDTYAVIVTTKGSIMLDKVKVQNNTNANVAQMGGAKLDNTASTAGAAVTVTNSFFTHNEANGLDISSKGAVTATGLVADENSLSGVVISNISASTAKPVTLNGFGQFNSNGGFGAYIRSAGVVTLNNITANDNGGVSYSGVYVDNRFGYSLPIPVYADVTVPGTNQFNNNGAVGLEIYSYGAIKVNNVTANENGRQGGYLNNCGTLAPADCTAKVSKPVTLSGINNFIHNGGNGLEIRSLGIITLKDITANANGGNGVLADNHLAGTAQAVTLTGTNIFSENTTNGLLVNSRGAISASNLIANNNANGWGVTLDNTYATTALSVKLTGNNEFKFNGGGGLDVTTKGAITTNSVVATNNSGNDGVRLRNDNGFSSAVTMTGTNVFTDNYNNGLEVYSLGAITLNNIKANGNGLSSNYGFGAYLNNSSSSTSVAVLLNGTNTFNNNYFGGLEIHSRGTVTLSKVTANENQHGNGAWIKNDYGNPLAPQNVTLTTANTFSGNYGGGLIVNTFGAINIANLIANGNGAGTGGLGADLNNADGVFPKDAILTGTNTFSNNVGGGLQILATGAITLNSVTANENHNLLNTSGGDGVILVNTTSISAFPKNVTINGTNTFNGNYNDGLIVVTSGAILTNNLTATDNGLSGANLNNGTDTTTPKTVTLNGVNTFNNNMSDGLRIYSVGKITVSKLEANSNHGIGAHLDNSFSNMSAGVNITGWVYVENDYIGLWVDSSGDITISNLNINKGSYQFYGISLYTSGGNVTVSGASQIFNCDAVGLDIITEGGAVILSNLTVSGNGLAGVSINTTGLYGSSGGSKGVTITGLNTFWDNGGYGLSIRTYGAIAISNIDAYNNSAAGVYLDNCGASGNGGNCNSSLSLTPKVIMITGSNFLEKNGTYGLHILSFGAISISNLHSTNNASDGAYLNNQWDSAASGIALTGINSFENNGASGLVAFSNGTISMSNVTADLNSGNGVSLDNHSVTGLTAVAVTLTGVNTFTNNGTTGAGSGLLINAGGLISLSNVTASGNQATGAFLDNFTNTSSLAVKPGVKLTGLNVFNRNLATGLDIQSRGAVDLVNTTADDNDTDGVHAFTHGTFALACGSMNKNTGNGWDLTAGGLITLKGVFGFGNTSGNVTSSTPMVYRACPVPAPVVVPPDDDSDKTPHGSNRIPPVYERK